MKGKYIPFLILPLFIFLFLSVSPLGIRGQQLPEPNEFGEWRNTGECIATECDSTEGKRNRHGISGFVRVRMYVLGEIMKDTTVQGKGII